MRFAGRITPIVLAQPTHGELGGKLAVVRPLAVGHVVEVELVAADRDRLAGLELRDPLDAPLRLADDA